MSKKNVMGYKEIREILHIFGIDIKDRYIAEATIYFRPDEAVKVELTEILFSDDQEIPKEVVNKYKLVKDEDG